MNIQGLNNGVYASPIISQCDRKSEDDMCLRLGRLQITVNEILSSALQDGGKNLEQRQVGRLSDAIKTSTRIR